MPDFTKTVDKLYVEWLEEFYEVNLIKAQREYEKLEEALEVQANYGDEPRVALILRKMTYLEELHNTLGQGDYVYLEGGIYDGEIHPSDTLPEGYAPSDPLYLEDDLPVWRWTIAD